MTQLIQEGSTDDVIFKNVFAVQHDGRMKVRGHEWDRLMRVVGCVVVLDWSAELPHKWHNYLV